MVKHEIFIFNSWKEGNVLFNDTLNLIVGAKTPPCPTQAVTLTVNTDLTNI